jgi:hypothetical protein
MIQTGVGVVYQSDKLNVAIRKIAKLEIAGVVSCKRRS